MFTSGSPAAPGAARPGRKASVLPTTTTTMRSRHLPFLAAIIFTAMMLALEAHKSAQLLVVQESLERLNRRLDGASPDVAADKRDLLIFYNKPPKTGSTTIRVAMNKAARAAGLRTAKCFSSIFWNEMGLKTIINRRSVNFYGCHTQLTAERYKEIRDLPDRRVVFVSGTRSNEDIVLSAYLQFKRDSNVTLATTPDEINREVENYKTFVDAYPVNALYNFHGGSIPLKTCPITWAHEVEMRQLASRYEVIVDLTKPDESATMMEVVTGIRPDFKQHFNERTKVDTPLIRALRAIDTSHRECGNALVHKVLMQQFNVIKDRLMQNMCLSEGDGTYVLCDKVILSKETMVERSRSEGYAEQRRLEGMPDIDS